MAKECALSTCTCKLPLGGLPRNSVVRITDRPDMTSAVDHGRKASTQPTNQILMLHQLYIMINGNQSLSLIVSLFGLH